MSSYKVRNYNLGYEMMLAAAKEFEKHVTGGGMNNQLFSYAGMDTEAREERAKKMADTTWQKQEVLFKEIATRVLDRTTGIYFTEDLVAGRAIGFDFPDELDKYMEIYQDTAAANLKSLKKNTYGLSDYTIRTIEYDTDPEAPVAATDKPVLRDFLKGLDPVELTQQTDPDHADQIKKAKSKEKPRKVFAPSAEFLDSDNPTAKHKLIQYPINTNPGDPDKYNAPSLASYVMKHHKLGMPGKKANHLSVFFGAVTPLEMSRCTPFINLMVLHESSKNSPTKKKLNQTAFMRFIRNDDGNMVLNESIFGRDFKPVDGSGTTPDYLAYDDTNITTEYSLMDIFTSPQTMANADINGKGSFDWVSKNIGQGKAYNSSPVLDPIQPFLTLNSLNVSITGAGYGIIASKVATIDLTLHDRSRLKEIAPLIASDKFGSTKVRIEFGWTHPDAGPLSNNTIGNYIDGLKDVGVYSVYASDYSFSGGSAVKIQLKLACSGFAESKTAPAAGGPVGPLSMFRDYIDRSVEDYIAARESEMSAEDKKKKLPEIRSIAKARARTAKSPTALIDFEDLQMFIANIKGAQDKKAMVSTLGAILNLDSITSEPGDVAAAISDDDFITANKLNAQQWLFSKLYAAKPGLTPDPFAHSFITQCDDTTGLVEDQDNVRAVPFSGTVSLKDEEKYVTIGKLANLFIGAPLATCGLYDEVQLMFYPLNHHAAGARKHTTASFPIEFTDFEKKMKEVISSNSRLTVQAFFAIIDKMVRDSYSRRVYGFSGLGAVEALDAFNNLEDDEAREAEAVGYYKERGNAIHENPKEAVKAYKAKLANQRDSAKADQVARIYSADGVELPAENKFVRPNLSIYYEVVPVIDPVLVGDQDNKWEFGIKFTKEDDKKDSDGFKIGKTALRVHIYDEEAVSDPTTAVLGSVIYEGVTGEVIGDFTDNALSSNASTQEQAISSRDSIVKKISQLSFGDIKQFVKRAYPSITYGASTGTVNNISISGNTSGQLSNVLMTENYFDNAKTATSDAKTPTDFEEIIMFPGSVNVNMMGMPLLFLGENMFIDFNTDTSLDNIYVVKSVNHSVEAGTFTSTVELVATNQGAVRSFRNQLTSKLQQVITLPE